MVQMPISKQWGEFMKKLILPILLILSFQSNADTKRAFSCNAITPDGGGLVFYAPMEEVFKALEGEIGYTADETLGGLQIGPHSFAIAGILEEDDEIIGGPNDFNPSVKVLIKAGRFGWVQAKCSMINW